MEIPLEASRAKLRELRDTPFKLSATGLPILTSEAHQKEAEEQRVLVSAAAEAKNGKTVKKRTGPKMRTCHLCGTPQLLHSFRMHYTRCAQAWEQDEAKKPINIRRPLPKGPRLENGDQPTERTTFAQLDVFNRQAIRIWKEQALETCPNCLRSFHAKALRAHAKGCHANDFLGASYVGLHRNASGHEGSRSYPTVQQSLERLSPRRIQVSKPGSLHLDPQKVEARRSVPRLSLASILIDDNQQVPEPILSASPTLEKTSTLKKESSSSYLPKKQPTMISSIDHLRKYRNIPKSVPSQNTQQPSSSLATVRQKKTNKRVEARLSVLETNHLHVKSTLERIERLLIDQNASPSRHQPRVLEKKKYDHGAHQHFSNLSLFEHNRIFRGNITLAWPEEVVPEEEEDNRVENTSPAQNKTKQNKSPSSKLQRRTAFLASKQIQQHSPLSSNAAFHQHNVTVSSPAPHNGFHWAPVRLREPSKGPYKKKTHHTHHRYQHNNTRRGSRSSYEENYESSIIDTQEDEDNTNEFPIYL